jgi:hypothetical protein
MGPERPPSWLRVVMFVLGSVQLISPHTSNQLIATPLMCIGVGASSLLSCAGRAGALGGDV